MSESKANSAIQLALNYIKQDNSKLLDKVLNALPLDKLGSNGDILLGMFLSTCATYNRTEPIDVILNAWEVIYPEDEQMQMLTRLFLIPTIDIQTLKYVILAHTDYTYVEALDDLMMGDNSQEVSLACYKADQIFGPQPYETYLVIQEHAEEQENYVVEEYVIDKIEQSAPYQDVPSWVKNFLASDTLPTEEELYNSVSNYDIQQEEIVILNDDEIVDKLTEGLYQIGISESEINNAKTNLYNILINATPEQKQQILAPVIDNEIHAKLNLDINLFRIFGPANPLVDQDLTLPGISNLYGGCRMLICDVFDRDEENDFTADWFTGFCDSCHLKIRHRWHAIRRPKIMGAWIGCMCGWDCVKKEVLESEQYVELDLEIINLFEKEVEEIGIQDRLPNIN